MTLKQALDVVHELTKEDRLRLADLIWLENADHETQGLTDAQAAELDRRLSHLDAHPADVVPWEEVEAAARARMRR